MTESTICPACSAPLEYAPDEQHVVCEFCSAEYDIVRDGDQARLQLSGQPQPQKDELSQAAQTVVQDIQVEAEEDSAETFPGAIREADGEPIAHSFASSATEWVTPDQVTPAHDLPTTPDRFETTPVTPTPPTGSRNRWIAISISAFVVACLMCLCLAWVLVSYFNTTGGQFIF